MESAVKFSFTAFFRNPPDASGQVSKRCSIENSFVDLVVGHGRIYHVKNFNPSTEDCGLALALAREPGFAGGWPLYALADNKRPERRQPDFECR